MAELNERKKKWKNDFIDPETIELVKKTEMGKKGNFFELNFVSNELRVHLNLSTCLELPFYF